MNRIYKISLVTIILTLLLSGCWTSKREKQYLLAKPHYEAAFAYHREGKIPQAKEEILVALDEYPEFVEAHIFYQKLRAKEVKPEELLDEYDRLLKQNQSNPRFHFLYGRLLGELEKQEAVYKRALELDPENPWGYFGLGWVAFKRSEYDEAAEYLEKCIELEPENPLFHCDLGGIYYYMGIYDDAIAELTVARELNPLYPTAYANLATAYYQRGDFDMAVTMLEEYIRLAPAADDVEEMQRKLIQLRGK
ncbi:hypothetical protein DRQ36_01210 [bacterium]|nr:MAG: hypothetical protein DRQ36_01210 [bacterium]